MENIEMDETIQAFKCQSCEALVREEDVDTTDALYECMSCGTTFRKSESADGESHRCPDCNKFASKLLDFACPECDEGEMDKVEAVENKEGDLVEAGEETP